MSYETQRGMYLHSTYAISLAREPLGVMDAWMWARQPKAADGKRHDIKESQRWIEGYEQVAEHARNRCLRPGRSTWPTVKMTSWLFWRVLEISTMLPIT